MFMWYCSVASVMSMIFGETSPGFWVHLLYNVSVISSESISVFSLYWMLIPCDFVVYVGMCSDCDFFWDVYDLLWGIFTGILDSLYMTCGY